MAEVLPGVVRQIGYVVEDLDAEAQRWAATYGIGPWQVIRSLALPAVTYRGTTVDIELSLALANSGDLQFELIQPHGDGPSCYREFLDSGLRGPHHLAWWTEDIDAVLFDAGHAGWTVLQAGELSGTRFVYFDQPTTPGTIAEVMVLNDASRWLAEHVAAESEAWDGVSDPVRTLG